MTMDDNYTQITWPKVREGDVLFHENGDRLTVDHVGELFVGDVSGRNLEPDVWGLIGFLPYRRKPEMPTVPGHYLDADGYHWKLTRTVNRPWYLSTGDRHFTTEEAQEEAPFTRLVPMPTEAQIDSIVESNAGAHDSLTADKVAVTAAVMALLNGV